MELPTYVFPFLLLTQRYTPTLLRLSAKILTLSTSALAYLTVGFTSVQLILRLSLKLQQDEKEACLTKCRTKFIEFLLIIIYLPLILFFSKEREAYTPQDSVFQKEYKTYFFIMIPCPP
jgi:hypothetical protein